MYATFALFRVLVAIICIADCGCANQCYADVTSALFIEVQTFIKAIQNLRICDECFDRTGSCFIDVECVVQVDCDFELCDRSVVIEVNDIF